MSFFRSFYQTLYRLCALYPCARNARDLRLKVVIHAGEVALEHIHGFDKLFGMDVILAHRLLKNSVPSQEYVLMTEAAHNWLGDFHLLEPARQTEYYEGIGVVGTVLFYPPAQHISDDKKPKEKFLSSVGHCVVGVDLFNTAPGWFVVSLNDQLLSESFHPSARAQPVKTRLSQLQTKVKWRPKHEIYAADLL